MRIGMTLFMMLTAFAVRASEAFSWRCVTPETTVEETDGGFVRLVTPDDGFVADLGAVGKPALPRKTFLFAIPDRSEVTDVTAEAVWETFAENVRIEPVAPLVRVGETGGSAAPDAAVYGGSEPWPHEAVTRGAVERLCGVRVLPVTVTPFRWRPDSGLLERAAAVTVRIALADGAERSCVLAPLMLDSVRRAVVNAADVTLEPPAASVRKSLKAMSAAPAVETADYLLISPPDFVADWTWYVGERKKVHPDITFKVKDTAEIYEEFPFGATNACRNAAESIHAYLRARRETMKFSYVVLGSAWLDAQNLAKTTTRYYGGETMTLSNSVPGVYGFPRESDRQIPSDMFYACLDMKNGQRYPWDANEDGVYIDQGDCSRNDLMPDVVVTRLTLNPYRPDSRPPYNRHALVTNYVAKLARGEAKGFHGHFRYGLAPDSTGSRRLRAAGDRMHYDEFEFYDGMYNMYDPRHSDWIEDNEVEPRRRIRDQFASWRPVLETRGMMNFTWTKTCPTLAAATDHYYAGDRDYGFVYSHGWAQGATHFQAGRFATCTGLTVLNGSNGPCDTGFPDYYVNGVLQYNLGDSGVTNPDGGALVSINNTRWGWAGGSHTGIDFDSSMSYFMLNRSLKGFNELYLDAGHAWFKGVRDYASFSFTQGGSTHTWTLTEQICYGDPLVRLPAPEDRYWTGGATGVWDTVTANWTNRLDDALTYYSASNVYFTVATDTTVVVTEPVGALRLSMAVFTQAVVSLVGASNGSLRVMQAIDVAGGDLHLDVAGGVGHGGITLRRMDWNDHDPELVFAGTHPFYVAKVAGAGRICLRGGGVTLDADRFPDGVQPVVFDGPGSHLLTLPNELRSRQANGLRKFGPLAITNSYVKLATADGFGRAAPVTNTLVGSRLEIAANAFYQLKGYWRQNGYAERLSAVFDVGGASEVLTSKGGLWTVAGTTVFNLRENAALALSAETKDCGGRIVINGVGSASVKTAASLAGDVEVGAGVTLVLDEIPLAGVTSLKIADGASVVMPDARSGYWQIVPVSSKLDCGSGVSFYSAANRLQRLDGQPSQTGAFFKEGALYRWRETDTHWTADLAHSRPKVLFGDLAADAFDVTVDLAVSPAFVSFSNTNTAYRFRAGDPSASLRFNGVVLSGDTRFDLPVAATEYVEVANGVAAFRRLVAPALRVGEKGTLALAGSHWTSIRLAEGAKLKALPGESLDWNFETTLTREGASPVEIDVSALTLGEQPQTLMRGAGHVWTVADLTGFVLNDSLAELRIVDGALCVVRGDGLKGPYDLAFADAANWNTSAWTAKGGPFAKPWGDSVLDWSSDVTLSVPADADATLTLDCPVQVASVAVGATGGRFTLADGGGTLSAATLDLRSCSGGAVIEIDTGSAAVLCPTNEDGFCELRKAGTGTLSPNAGTLVLHACGEWTLPAGAQGTIRLVRPRGWKPFRVAFVAPGFEMGGLTFEAVDEKGVKDADYVFALSEGAIWCTPVGVSAQVGAGTNEWDDLVWTDCFGHDAPDVDFRAVRGFRLVGGEGSYVTSSNGFAGVLDRVSAKGPVTLLGRLAWTPSKAPSAGDLLLGGGFKVKVNLATAPNVLDHARLGLADDGILVVSHGGGTFNASAQDWSGLHGTGHLVHTNATAGNWLAWPAVTPAEGHLAFRNEADVVLSDGVSETTPLAVRNLSGSRGFRSDWGSSANAMRPVRTVQTCVTEFAGVFSGKHSGRDSKLIVSSDAPTSTVEKAIILSGNNTNWHYLDIETNGCVILTGQWSGQINVRGLLLVPNGKTPSATVRLLDGGRKETIGVIPVPATFADSEPPEVSPDLPPQEEPDVPPVEDKTVRVVRAEAAEGESAWRALDWYDTNGVRQASVDWAAVERATVTGPADAVVTMDALSFAGVAVLKGGLRVETHVVPSFVLGAESACSIETRLVSPPTASGTFLRTEAGFTPSEAVQVTLRDQFGGEFIAPVAVAWTENRYAFIVQNLDAPTYRHTFSGTVTDPLYNSTGLPETTDPAQFEPCREDGQALVNWYRGSTKGPLMNPFPTAWTLNIVARTPNNRNGVLFGFGYGAYCPKGFCFASDGTDRAAFCIWKEWNVTDRLTASVPLATTQFHCYTATYDGSRLRFYVDGELADERTDTEGWTASNVGWFQFWGLCSGKYPSGGVGGGLTGASGGAVDDWSFYRTCLTPESVKALAARFPAWPQTTEAEAWGSKTNRWSELVWEPEVENWATEQAAQIVGREPGATVLCDEPAFSNKLVVAGGVTLVATNELSFALAPYPVGTVAFALDDVTTSRRLVRTTGDFTCDDALFAIDVKGPAGTLPPDPWTVTRLSDGWYWLRIQDVSKPKYSLTFDGSCDARLDGTTAPALSDRNGAEFVAARAGASKALTARNPYFTNGLGTYANWTMNVVARMPTTANGIVFAYGQTSQGLALYTPTTDVVALGAWSGSAKRGDLLSVAVTNAQLQFHSYAIVATGSRISLWVDGVKRGEAAQSGYPGNGNAQFFSVHGGTPAGFASGIAGAIDDWRFYDECLAPSGIGLLAADFRPWPEYRYADLDGADTDPATILWQGAEGADNPLLLKNVGGSLLLTNACTLATSLTASGPSLALRFAGDGVLRSDAGLSFASGFTLDASGLDGTNLARCAVAGAPYVRWLVRGAYTGKPKVTGLPALPEHYTVRAEDFSSLGVRLVVTAPQGARLGAVSVSIGTDDFSQAVGDLGLHPVKAAEWMPYGSWQTTFQTFGPITVAALPMADGKIDPMDLDKAGQPLILRHTSFDGNGPAYDGLACGYALSNLTSFASAYRVLVYMNSNQAEGGWGPVTIGGRAYTGLQVGEENEWATLSDSTMDNWGKLLATPVPREGVNVVISDVLTNDVIDLVGHRDYATKGNLRARGQIAAFQVVRVGDVPELACIDYAADVTGSTDWRGGEGDGLVPLAGRWTNDAESTITLTQNVASAELVFDTPTTGTWMRVVNAADQSLTLSATTPDVSVETLDATAAAGVLTFASALGAKTLLCGADTRLAWTDRGTTACRVDGGRKLTLSTNLAWGVTGDAVAAGGHVRLLGEYGPTTIPVRTDGAVVSFERARLVRQPKGNNEVPVLSVGVGDVVTYDTIGEFTFNSLNVRGGSLTLSNGSASHPSTVWYGGLGGTTVGNSAITVTGGRLTVAATGTNMGNTSDCGLLFGNTGSADVAPSILVSGGEMEVTGGILLWETGTVTVRGDGVLKTWGIGKGGTRADSAVTLGAGGTLAVGAGGIANYKSRTLSVSLAGGTLLATDAAAVRIAANVSGENRLQAVTGRTLTFAEAPTGSGTLVCGDAVNDGRVVFEKGVAPTLTMDGAFTLWLTAAQAEGTEAALLFRTTAGFDRTKLVLLGPDGGALPEGELLCRDGKALWLPAVAAVKVDLAEGVDVRLPKAWLAARAIDSTTLEANHGLLGANGLPVAVSYCLGLEPTNASDRLDCAIEYTANGKVRLHVPNLANREAVSTAAAVRYVLQQKEDLSDAWRVHSTNEAPSVECDTTEEPRRFFRYLLDFYRR